MIQDTDIIAIWQEIERKHFIMRILKTKTFWVGLAWIIKGGITMYLSGDFASGGQDILIGLALITGRDALKKLESK